jgi:hypothetical protein
MALTPFLTGANLSAITIYGIAVDASGNGTVGSGQNIRAFIQGVDAENSRDLEDIRPLWRLQKNMVETGYGHGARLSCLQRSDAAQTLNAINYNYNYARLVWVAGAETYTFDYKIAGLTQGVANRGQNINVMSLEPCDFGTTQGAIT